MDKKFTVGLIVSNHFGVLNRVAGLYGKRCYNIDSLAVGETEDPGYSRITIVSTGDEYMKSQVVKQLKKLHDVKQVVLFEEDSIVSVEHMLIKLKADGDDKAIISDMINRYGGKVMDFGSEFITAEITGDTPKIEQFIQKSSSLGIIEVCRSGLIAMSQGNQDQLSIQKFKI